MKGLLVLPAISFITYSAFAQPCYIQSGSNIVKIGNCNADQIKATGWVVRLYEKGEQTTGNSYWGTIKGSTSSEVMEKLKKDQKFELDFNKFIGKGSVENEVNTHFNPLGPIAVMDNPQSGESSLTEAEKKVEDLYTKAVDIFYTGLDVKNNLDVILKGKENPYADVGSNFMQYSEGIKDAVLQIRTLQNLLERNASITLQDISKKINEIDLKLNDAQVGQAKIITALNIKSDQKQTTLSNPGSKDKKITGNAFYIFLTADLPVNGKFLTVISAPILHNGTLADAMTDDKEEFIKQVDRQLPDKPEDFKQSLSKDNYTRISVHYGKPYSTSLLKSVNESVSAIEAYKQSVKDAVDGLPNANLIEFFQLK